MTRPPSGKRPSSGRPSSKRPARSVPPNVLVLAALPSLGITSAQMLIEVGIRDEASLRAMGPEACFRSLRFRFGRRVSTNFIYLCDRMRHPRHWLEDAQARAQGGAARGCETHHSRARGLAQATAERPCRHIASALAPGDRTASGSAGRSSGQDALPARPLVGMICPSPEREPSSGRGVRH